MRDRQFEELKFRRQHQIGNYIADFCCVEHHLTIELDGDIHTLPDVAAKDAQRDAYLQSVGYKVLRFQNQLVLDQPEEFLRQIAAALELPSTSGRGVGGEGNTPSPNGIGVFWQTQGSGKSFSMVFFAQKVLRRLAGNWTFVVVTDRVELDDQIAKTFAACGAVNDTAESHASSGAHLRELLRGNQRYVFTLIHKFRAETPSSPTLLPGGEESKIETNDLPSNSGRGAGGEGQPSPMPLLSEREDIIVMVDEAHRSQYDTLALNMRSALPKALFLAFTGTPLISGEERTKEVFGDYVSIYDFQQPVEDGATVPLFYENRTPELQLVNPDLNEDIYNLIEAAELDQDQETKLERELSKQYHILTRDDRLETVAQDIVRHFLGRGFQGKAMVVSIDKATALKMHDKVKRILGGERERLKQSLKDLNAYPAKPRGSAPPPAEGGPIRELLDQLRRIEKVDQALIVSPAQNEVETMKKHGLDIVPHRRRMNESQPALDEKFKDPEDPLSLVFVCAMWLTGFDAPSCSTIYLDKPMRNHTLMQTIARANRVYPGKHSGTIVDYANVFVSLEKALAIYGAGEGGTNPVQDKATLVESLKKAVANATEFCSGQGVDLPAIEDAPSGDMGRLGLLGDAVNTLISPDPLRREFLAHERIVGILYRAVKPSPAALEFSTRVNCLQSIADAIRAQTSPGTPDISGIMGRINELLDDSIEGVEMAEKPVPVLDHSKIDFAALSKRFKQSKHRNIELEALKVSVQAMLDRLIAMNRTRMDFRKKFEELIDAYNAGSTTIEQLYQELLNLSRTLTEEQARHVREKLTEEELTVFDLLTRPGPELTTEEKEEVKKVSRLLLERLKTVLTLNWRQTIQARARIRDAIEATLDEGLPRTYTPAVYKTKCGTLFEHVFERFPDEGGGGKIGRVA